MTITLTLEPELEERLQIEAGRHGLPAEQYAGRVLDEHIGGAERARRERLIALLQSWNEEEVDEGEALDDDFFPRLEANRVAFREITLPE